MNVELTHVKCGHSAWYDPRANEWFCTNPYCGDYRPSPEGDQRGLRIVLQLVCNPSGRLTALPGATVLVPWTDPRSLQPEPTQ